MKIARFLWRNKVRWGTIDGDQVNAIRLRLSETRAGRQMRSLSDVSWGRNSSPPQSSFQTQYALRRQYVTESIGHISEIRLLAPIDPRYNKVVAIAANYGERDERDGPGIFMKQRGTIVGPDAPIIYPRTGISVIHEAELGVVIGKAAKNVSVESALEYILGFTCVNDVSGSRFTADDTGRGLSMRWKHFDTFCPIGPWIETDDRIIRRIHSVLGFTGRSAMPYPRWEEEHRSYYSYGQRPSDAEIRGWEDDQRHNRDREVRQNSLRVQCRVNGETAADGHTGQMLWNIPELISWVSEVMTLYPGDIIATGCPGVGEINVGDTVEVEIQDVGTLRNFVVADTAEPTSEWPALIS